MTSNPYRPNWALFLGLMRAQLLGLVVAAGVAGMIAGVEMALIAAWGGTISVIAFAWSGFQLWLHPGNHALKRMATAAIRAEMGKIALLLLLLWLSFKHWPELREAHTAAALLISFFLVQAVGSIWLARATGTSNDERASGKHDANG